LRQRRAPSPRPRGAGDGTDGTGTVTTTERKSWTAFSLPHAIEAVDRVPKERYFDPDFYRLECENLWPRVWQMACRLEEIPDAGDFAEYQILDQSVIVVRTQELGVSAFHNACRHRGVAFAQGRGHRPGGFVCPFHGWCYATDGTNTRVTQVTAFAAENLEPAQLNLVPVRCETWGGCAWINLDDSAPPLRPCIEPFATTHDAWKVESLRAEWWYTARLPVNWKLGEEAFVEQYHVLQSHPQLRIPGRYPGRNGEFDAREFAESELHYLRVMSEGMAGMVHANDVRIAEQLCGLTLPDSYQEARATWEHALNEAVSEAHRARGCDIPDLNELQDLGYNQSMGYCFPHYFILPMYSSAIAYRFRPLGPEETLMDMWSLTRFPQGQEPETPPIPDRWEHDDPRWPPIPSQDFSNLPKQQRGLHSMSFEYMRLARGTEGHISNYQRVVDAFLAGCAYAQILPALEKINVNPLEMPVVDLAF
jgi:phenylpropionate dioxygenase-like ring-hydroxylating dioxygenase large terminal subunit